MTDKIGISTMEAFDNRTKDSVGSSRIRARWLMELWPEATPYSAGQHYDVMVYQKVYWPEMMKQFKGIQILDICDPDWLEGKPVFEFVDRADATVTSTPALAEYIKMIRPQAEVLCIPDRVYLPEHKNKKTKHEGVAKSVAWFGFGQNAHYLEQAFDFISSCGLKLTIISNTPYNPPMIYRTIPIDNVPYAYPGIHNELIKHDMVIMPDPNDERGRFKSNNKTLTAWALGLPVATNADEVEKFLDPVERNKEMQLREKEIAEKWDVKYSVDEYKALIQKIKEKKSHEVR